MGHLKDAIRVLEGHSQLLVSPKRGGYRKDEQYTWTLNGPKGMALSDLGTFHASMRFHVIDADPARHELPFRVTTDGYLYRLEASKGYDLWRVHWHPVGDSHAKEPHIHIPPGYEHLPTGRISFEQVIGWCVEQGAPLRYDKREVVNRLAEAGAPHVLYRSWSDQPPLGETAS